MKPGRPPKPQQLPLICKVHGKLADEQHVLAKRKGRADRFRCRLCKIQHQRGVYARGGNRSPKKGEPGYERQLETSRLLKQRQRDNLTDRIVMDQLIRGKGLEKADITPELIELQRTITMIKRIKKEGIIN